MRRSKLGLCLVGVIWLAFTVSCSDDSSSKDDDGGAADSDAEVGHDAGPQCTRDADCDDNLFCSGQEHCVAGSCKAGEAVHCDDGIACTLDKCSEKTRGCISAPPDQDDDGHPTNACKDAQGKALGDDCDDEDPLRFPGNIEACDPAHHDEDCDPKTFGEKDSDDDGFLDATCCNASSDEKGAKLVCGDDCDDFKPTVHPDATEACDLYDNDCDGKTDEGVATAQYPDGDRDGHGKKGSKTVKKCADSVGFAASDDDCNDDDATIFVGQFEICDMKDNDCDGQTDEVHEDAPWFADEDEDGFGDPTSTPIYACTPIPGRSLSHNDCDDTKPKINPKAAELCDAVDNDCSGRRDFMLDVNDFEDDDGDGVADDACGPGGSDCNDRDPATSEGATEICDDLDNDCDDAIDEDTDETVWYTDHDGDGWGIKRGTALTRCTPIPGRAANLGDCDDEANSVHPLAPELCNGVDDDCDGKPDEGTDSSCKLDDAVAVCKLGTCSVLSCLPGHGDCNGEPADGCECAATPMSSGGACVSDNDCSDGDYCNGKEHCIASQCYEGAPVSCSASDSVLQGDVFIHNSLDIAGLAGIETITGTLTICAQGLANLVGLESLRAIGGDLIVDGDLDDDQSLEGNNALGALVGSGLINLTTVQGSIRIEDNPQLTVIRLPSLVAAGSLTIRRNAALANLDGLGALAALDGDFTVTDNPKLSSLSGLKMTSVGCAVGPCTAQVHDNPRLCEANKLFDPLHGFATLLVANNSPDDCGRGGVMHGPHVRTFDSVGYRFNAVGEFTLVQSTVDALEVQIRTSAVDQRDDMSRVTAAAAQVGSDRLTYYLGSGGMYVNGAFTTFVDGFNALPGGGYVQQSGTTLTLQWPDGSTTRWVPHASYLEIEVAVAGPRRGKLRGLLGSGNGRQNGELVSRTGTVLEPKPTFGAFYDLYANSWRLTMPTSLFDYFQGEITDTYTNKAIPAGVSALGDFDNVQLAVAKATCTSVGGSLSAAWLDACVLDYASTGDSAYAEGLAVLRDPLAQLELLTGSVVGSFPPFTSDPTDQTPFSVKQVIPTNGSANIDPHTAIVIYFDDEIDPSSITDKSLIVMESSGQAVGSVTGDLSTAGNTVLFFQPFEPLTPNSTISVTLPADGLLDDGGNALDSAYSFTFTTSATTTQPPGDLGFETGNSGWSFSGDAAIIAYRDDDIMPRDGTHMIGLSTEMVFTQTVANANTSSSLSSGPISVPAGSKDLVFDYDFASAEFDEYVGESYDDSFTVTITGPGGGVSQTVSSVNLVGAEASVEATISGLSGGQHTGWQTTSVDVSSLGSPITLSFYVSDVGDSAVTTAVFVDKLRFQ